eukprot:TRINITY_DN23435_c0_g1_i3.p1 TRINITY_DN23435_c0_g1~~TRINITY_DN23435_c0_g1_i3.p1  ORF type:complete len:189 (-),score=55.17 TRINITY_DN23435_c0_g1_i3:189-755(-)
MKYGQHLKAESIPEWRPHYMDYKSLKKILKAGLFSALCSMDEIGPNPPHTINDSSHLNSFVHRLEQEVCKVEQFFRSQVLRDVKAVDGLELALSSMSLTPQTREQEAAKIMSEVMEVMQRLPLMEKFAHQNEEGLRKIVKKFNKLFFSQLSTDSVSQGCSFLRSTRNTPLVNIRSGASSVHNLSLIHI